MNKIVYVIYPKTIGTMDLSRHRRPDYLANLTDEEIRKEYEIYEINLTKMTIKQVD